MKRIALVFRIVTLNLICGLAAWKASAAGAPSATELGTLALLADQPATLHYSPLDSSSGMVGGLMNKAVSDGWKQVGNSGGAGTTYVNETTKQVVVAYGGTVSDETKLSGFMSPQYQGALKYAEDAKQSYGGDYSITIAGLPAVSDEVNYVAKQLDAPGKTCDPGKDALNQWQNKKADKLFRGLKQTDQNIPVIQSKKNCFGDSVPPGFLNFTRQAVSDYSTFVNTGREFDSKTLDVIHTLSEIVEEKNTFNLPLQLSDKIKAIGSGTDLVNNLVVKPLEYYNEMNQADRKLALALASSDKDEYVKLYNEKQVALDEFKYEGVMSASFGGLATVVATPLCGLLMAPIGGACGKYLADLHYDSSGDRKKYTLIAENLFDKLCNENKSGSVSSPALPPATPQPSNANNSSTGSSPATESQPSNSSSPNSSGDTGVGSSNTQTGSGYQRQQSIINLSK